MSKADKTFSKMKNNPRDWSIEDVISVTDRHTIEHRNDGGSHFVFSHPEIQEAVTVPAHRPINQVYIKKIIAMIEKIKEQTK